MKNESDKNAWYISALKILKLETTTRSGRINLAGVFILAIFSIIYTTQDAIRHLISAVENTVKSIALKSDIYHPYESSSVIEAVIPIFIGFILCIIFLYVDDNKKKELKKGKDNQDIEKVENPLDKI